MAWLAGSHSKLNYACRAKIRSSSSLRLSFCKQSRTAEIKFPRYSFYNTDLRKVTTLMRTGN